MGCRRSVHGKREFLVSLVAVDGERREKPELRNGFGMGFGELGLKWHPQKRGESCLLRCGGYASKHRESDRDSAVLFGV